MHDIGSPELGGYRPLRSNLKYWKPNKDHPASVQVEGKQVNDLESAIESLAFMMNLSTLCSSLMLVSTSLEDRFRDKQNQLISNREEN